LVGVPIAATRKIRVRIDDRDTVEVAAGKDGRRSSGISDDLRVVVRLSENISHLMPDLWRIDMSCTMMGDETR
jgi:hypothetical protein